MNKLLPFGEKAHRFAFRPPEQDARINILEGSIRSSKTISMLPKTLSLCRYPVDGHKLITGVSKQTIYNNVLSDLFDIVGSRNHTYNRSSGELTLCGCKFLVIGAKDEGSEKYIRGLTVGAAYVDEGTLIPRSFLLMLIGRMSPDQARLYLTTNPGPPQHYLKTEFLDDAEKRQRGDLWSEHFTLDDNPNVSQEYKEFVARSYTGMFFKRYILGLWVAAEGAIYGDCFTDDLLFDDSTCPPALRGSYVERIIAIDYGTTNPQVYLEILDDGTTYWVMREYYWDSKKMSRQKTDGEYAEDLVEFIGDAKDAQVIIDPSAASFKAEMRTRGIWHIDGDNDVEDGIRMTSTMFNRKRVRVHRHNCPEFIAEHQGYVWNEKKSVVGTEEPVKSKDHTCDAMRMAVKTKIHGWRLAA